MSNYAKNKAASRTVNTEPTLTDQSQANDTDINVIVAQVLRTGATPNAPHGQPIYGDFTEVPDNLRDMMELADKMDSLRQQLPKELQELPIEQLMGLTPDEIQKIITPEQPANTQPEGSK